MCHVGSKTGMNSRRSLQTRLLLLLLIMRAVCASTPVASCVDAGFTSCCDSEAGQNCYAPPTYCLCDPYCREHDDCCPDIDLICPPDPVAPDFLLAIEPTYHTVRLLWRRPTMISNIVNQSYSLIYWEFSVLNSTVEISINQTVLKSSGEIVELVLNDLSPGQLYQWKIEARTRISSAQSKVLNFSTLAPVELKRLDVKVLNTSSVLISWRPPQLSSSINLYQYTLYYAGTKAHNRSVGLLDNGLLALQWTSAIVTGLKSDIFYHFWMEVVLVDGAEYKLHSENSTVYVPDSVTVQLRGGSFKDCEYWKDEMEDRVHNLFRNITYQALGCVTSAGGIDDRSKQLIESDTLYCVNGGSSKNQAVYRATVYSSSKLSTDRILSLLEQRVKSGDNESGIELERDCPVIVVRESQPLCGVSSSSTDTNCGASNTDRLTTSNTNCSCVTESCEGAVITAPLLITALIAEAFLILFILLLAIAVLLVRRRYYIMKESEEVKSGHQHQSTQPNVYS